MTPIVSTWTPATSSCRNRLDIIPNYQMEIWRTKRHRSFSLCEVCSPELFSPERKSYWTLSREEREPHNVVWFWSDLCRGSCTAVWKRPPPRTRWPQIRPSGRPVGRTRISLSWSSWTPEEKRNRVKKQVPTAVVSLKIKVRVVRRHSDLYLNIWPNLFCVPSNVYKNHKKRCNANN